MKFLTTYSLKDFVSYISEYFMRKDEILTVAPEITHITVPEESDGTMHMDLYTNKYIIIDGKINELNIDRYFLYEPYKHKEIRSYIQFETGANAGNIYINKTLWDEESELMLEPESNYILEANMVGNTLHAKLKKCIL